MVAASELLAVVITEMFISVQTNVMSLVEKVQALFVGKEDDPRMDTPNKVN